MAELSNAQKKEWAQLLYNINELSQKEIAAKVGISEKTMSKWVTANENEWDRMRKSLLTTKTDILRNLYSLLDKINRQLKDTDSIGDSKIADMYIKYTASIRNLETETSIAEIIEVARMFGGYLQGIDPVYALSVLNHFDAFIKERLKHF